MPRCVLMIVPSCSLSRLNGLSVLALVRVGVFLHPFPLNLSLCLLWVSCSQHRFESRVFICSDSLSVLIAVFGQFTFKRNVGVCG